MSTTELMNSTSHFEISVENFTTKIHLHQSNEIVPVIFKSMMFIIFAHNFLVNSKSRSLKHCLDFKILEKKYKLS